jgi:hypothetical protein
LEEGVVRGVGVADVGDAAFWVAGVGVLGVG